MLEKSLSILLIISCVFFISCGDEDKLNNNTKENQTTNEVKKEPEFVDISLNAIGDMLVHNTVFNSMKKGDSFDFHPMFEDIAPDIEKADFTIANLETVFGGKEAKYTGYPMFNTPEQLGYALKNTLGVDLVSTSNNHSLDRGFTGLNQTIDFLKEYNLDYVGTAESEEVRNKPYVKTIKGVNIGFVSYTYGTNGNIIPKGKEYAVNLIDKEQMVTDCKKLEDSGAEFIVALMHWGNEYEHKASTEQQELAKWLFENTNTSLIIGNHAHVVQPIKEIVVTKDGKEKKGIVSYALGNFTGNQNRDYSDTGIILNVDLRINKNEPFSTDAIKKVSYIPTYIDINPFSTGKGFRTINVNKAIADYETGNDKLITEVEYNKMKKYKDSYAKLIPETPIILAEK